MEERLKVTMAKANRILSFTAVGISGLKPKREYIEKDDTDYKNPNPSSWVLCN